MQYIDITSEDIAAARDWALDCDWVDHDEIERMSARAIVRGIDRHYEGGWNQFMEDAR